ncbi:hypothetical protein EniLVp02_0157 [Vibrio phage EniLVp02]
MSTGFRDSVKKACYDVFHFNGYDSERIQLAYGSNLPSLLDAACVQIVKGDVWLYMPDEVKLIGVAQRHLSKTGKITNECSPVEN